MDLNKLVGYVKTRYKADLTDPQIIEHLNEKYLELSEPFTADVRAEDDSLSTVEGQTEYTLGADSRRIIEIHIVSDDERRRLRRMDPVAVLYPRETGLPRRWYSLGMNGEEGTTRQQFGLDPIPDLANDDLQLYVIYEPEPVKLDDDGDIPKFVPDEKHHVIAWGAMATLAAQQEDYGVAQTWDGHYSRAFNEIMVKHAGLSRDNFPDSARQVTPQ